MAGDVVQRRVQEQDVDLLQHGQQTQSLTRGPVGHLGFDDQLGILARLGPARLKQARGGIQLVYPPSRGPRRPARAPPLPPEDLVGLDASDDKSTPTPNGTGSGETTPEQEQ